MTKLLEEALARVEMLPDEDQDRAAEILIAFSTTPQSYTLTPEQISGIHEAMGQADHGEFASAVDVKAILGRTL